MVVECHDLGFFGNFQIIEDHLKICDLDCADNCQKISQIPTEFNFYIPESILKVKAKKLVKYEWNQFHEKLEECKQTADLSIYPGSNCLPLMCTTQHKKSCITFFDEFFYCSIIISITDVFSQNYGPQY